MPKSPKVLSRQARREARAKMREEKRNTPFGSQSFEDKFTPTPVRTSRPFAPLNDAQREYADSIGSSRIVFGTGPAGTGKTYLATRMAAKALENGETNKIYLTRPAVEAGESLGFLPGELDEKYEPFLRPFKDALRDHFGDGHMEYLIRKKIIEPVPLGYLRGSTFKDCWVLLDEAQNTTPLQMKMFLTRIGDNSTMIINGDIKQKDIAGASGLIDALDRFENKPGIGVVHFGSEDIVRSGICRMIVEGYES